MAPPTDQITRTVRENGIMSQDGVFKRLKRDNRFSSMRIFSVLAMNVFLVSCIGINKHVDYMVSENVRIVGGLQGGAILGAETEDEALLYANAHCKKIFSNATVASFKREKSLFYCGSMEY